MPHVLVKLAPGRSDELKTRLAEEIAKDIVHLFNCAEEAVSVAFEEVKPRDWAQEVYKPEIQDKWDTVYKKPGYNPFEK